MAAITQAVLRTRILQTLGVLAAEETASAEDAAVVDAAISALYGELGRFGTVDFALSSIPDWAQDSMRDAVAFRIAPTFGVASNRLVELAALFTAAWALLTKHIGVLGTTDTKADLRNKILQTLGHLRPGEVSPAAFTEMCEDGIDHLFAWYAERGTLGYTATTIPGRSMIFLRDAVAYQVALVAGVRDAQALTILKARHDDAIAELDRRMTILSEGNTKYHVRNLVLQRLGLLGLAEIATAAQKELVEYAIDELFGWYTERGTLGFQAASIPAWATMLVRDAVAYRVALAPDVRAQIDIVVLKSAHDAAIAELDRRMTAIDEANTKYKLRNLILQHLGLLGIAEKATGAQKAVVEEQITRTLDQLRAHRVVSFGETNIPDWAMTPLRDFISYTVGPSFQVNPQRLSLLRADHNEALAELKRQHITTVAPDNQVPVIATYY